MSLPYLKPLIQNAYLAYRDIRASRKASNLRSLASSVISIAGYDTSNAKELALTQLNQLNPEGTLEEKNKILATQLDSLLPYSQEEGSNFKAIFEILRRCAALVNHPHPQNCNLTTTFFENLPYIAQLRIELKNDHPFFKQLRLFIQQVEDHNKALFLDEQKQQQESLETANTVIREQKIYIARLEGLDLQSTFKEQLLLSEVQQKYDSINELQNKVRVSERILHEVKQQLDQNCQKTTNLSRELTEKDTQLTQVKQELQEAYNKIKKLETEETWQTAELMITKGQLEEAQEKLAKTAHNGNFSIAEFKQHRPTAINTITGNYASFHSKRSYSAPTCDSSRPIKSRSFPT